MGLEKNCKNKYVLNRKIDKTRAQTLWRKEVYNFNITCISHEAGVVDRLVGRLMVACR